LDNLGLALIVTYFIAANTKFRKLAPIHSIHKENGSVLIEKRRHMEPFIISLVILVALDLAVLRWGFDSRDGIDSHEWERSGSTFFPNIITRVVDQSLSERNNES
jgi:hypothetical protein